MSANKTAGQHEWQIEARQILRAELERDGQTYKMLAKRLSLLGVEETERSLANKIARGAFSFVFFLQVMRALEVETISFAPRKPAHKRQAPGVDPDVEA